MNKVTRHSINVNGNTATTQHNSQPLVITTATSASTGFPEVIIDYDDMTPMQQRAYDREVCAMKRAGFYYSGTERSWVRDVIE